MADPLLDPERRLALHYLKPLLRDRVETLWELDATLGAVLVTGREPMISGIRLAWWREALERLDAAPPPAEPMLKASAQRLLPSGISGQALSRLEEGWSLLLAPERLNEEDLLAYAGRGALLFELTARLLPGAMDPERLTAAGRTWALVDLARRSRDAEEAGRALAIARQQKAGGRWPVPLRPLGMLHRLAADDALAGYPLPPIGSPGRLLRMMKHRLTGR